MFTYSKGANLALILILIITMGFPGMALAAPEQPIPVQADPQLTDVPLFLQWGQPWSNDFIAPCGATIADRGSSVTSVAMVFKYLGLDTDPGRLNTWLIDNDGYNGCDVNPDWAINISYQLQYSWWMASSLDSLQGEIDLGNPVVLWRNLDGTNYYAVATGYSGSLIYVNDPVYGRTNFYFDEVVGMWAFHSPYFTKVLPGNGDVVPLSKDPYTGKINTTQLLTWLIDPNIPEPDAYEYCIDETPNNQCDTAWLFHQNPYSGPDFDVFWGHTYYWQVRTQIGGLYANHGQWWSFTVSSTYQDLQERVVYDDISSQWQYIGPWTVYQDSESDGGTVHSTSVAGSAAQITFSGTQFILTYVTGANRGRIDVYVDGNYSGAINAHSSKLVWQRTWLSGTYPVGTHTLRLVHAGVGTFIDVDAIEILGVVGPGLHDDFNPNWIYSGSWTENTNAYGAINDTTHSLNTASSAAQISFDGFGFALTYVIGYNRGLIDVYVDGNYSGTIHAYNTSVEWQQTWISPTYSYGVHTVRFVHAGGGAYVDIDAIEIFGNPPPPPVAVNLGTYDDTHTNWTFGSGWITYSGNGPFNNTLHYSNVVGSEAQITFDSAKFTFYYVKGPSRGLIDVYVDGAKIDTIDAHNTSIIWQATWTSPAFAPGTHTARFVHAGGGTYVDVDAIRFFNPFDPIPPVAINTLAATTGGIPGTVALNWTAPSDDNANGLPVTSYLVRYSTSVISTETDWNNATVVTNGMPTPPKAAGGTESMAVSGLAPGATYYFAVRAQDGDANLAGLSNSPSAAAQNLIPVGTGKYDDPNPSWVYLGIWTTHSGSGPYNNTLHYTGAVGSEAQIAFNGTKFILTYTKASNRGLIDVYVDGTKVNTINAYNATTNWKQTWTSPVYSYGVHTVRLIHAGGGTYIDVDAIEIVAPLDPIPPAAITNLAATTGTTVGTVALTWTAPGDDGNTGTASAYLVRYSGQPITTEADWNNATVVTSGIPTPKAAGGAENMTISGLAPGATYYFAVRARDEEPNLAALSNSPSAAAQNLIPVGTGKYDDPNINWLYSGTWATYSGSGPYNNTLHYSNVVGSEAQIAFNGTKFILTYVKGSDRGLIDVYVDGTKVNTINAYNATTIWRATWASPVLAAGTHTVRLIHAGGGTYIDVDAIEIVIPADTVAPAAISDLAAHTGKAAGTIELTWTAPGDDGNTGTASAYLVRYSGQPITTEADWNNATVAMSGIPTPKVAGQKEDMIVSGLAPSRTYYFAIRAQDEGPNLAELSNSPSATTLDITPVGPGTYDDPNTNWLYSGTWATYSGSGPYNNTLHYSNVAGSAAQIVFNGTKFVLTYVKGSDRGLIDVIVDGVNIATINANSANTVWQATWTSPILLDGRHTVRLVHAGGGTYADIDAITIIGPLGPGTYDDPHAGWIFSSGWLTYSGSGPYNNTLHYSNVVGSDAQVSFNGTQFTLYYVKSNDRGLIDVYVDGTKIDTINAYSASTVWQATWTSSNLGPGPHTVRFVHAGGRAYVDIDAITILP